LSSDTSLGLIFSFSRSGWVMILGKRKSAENRRERGRFVLWLTTEVAVKKEGEASTSPLTCPQGGARVKEGEEVGSEF